MNKKEHSFSALLVDKIDESENESENADSENGEFPLDETGTESPENEKQRLERQYSMCVQNVDYLIARVIVEDGASALTTGINYRFDGFTNTRFQNAVWFRGDATHSSFAKEVDFLLDETVVKIFVENDHFRTIRIKDGDRVNNIITNSLEKYSLKNSKLSGWKLCQKNENGNELIFTENSSVYHAVCGYKGEFSRANRDFTLVSILEAESDRLRFDWTRAPPTQNHLENFW